MDIDKKIKELQGDLERLEAELDSINRANYDGHETKTLMAKEKQIREKQSELLKYKKAKEMASIKDSMEILRLSGYTVDSFLKVWEDDKAIIRQDTNSGLYEVKIKKTGSSKIVKSLEEAQKLYKSSAKDAESNKSEAQDASYPIKYKGYTIKKDFNGDLKVYDKAGAVLAQDFYSVEQAKKAIDKREEMINSRGAKDGGPGSGVKGHTTSKEPSYTSRSGYNFEEPKVIEAAIKKVKASGHADPYYLAGLEQALQRSKKERGIKDSCSSRDGSPLEPQINQLRQKIKNLYDKAGDALNEKNKEKYNIIMSQIKIEEKSLNGLIKASMQDSCGEKVFTKGTEDDDATKEGAIKEYGAKEGSFEDACTKDLNPSDYDETMTTAEARQYWNKYHNSDPILKMYKSFEEWYRESKINGYIKDADPKVAEAEAMIKLCGGVM